MNPPTQLAPAPPVSRESYSPVAVSAIVGFSLAVVSILIFVFHSAWFLAFVTVPALIVSIMARRQVLRSEGTLAGGTLALSGIIIALVSGLGWVTSYFTAYLVIRGESLAFVTEFTEKLQRKQAGHAFLDSVREAERTMGKEEWKENVQQLRAQFSAQDRGYDTFRNQALVDLALRYGDQARWVHKGIDQWGYEQGSFTVHHRFHVDCPTHAGDVVIVVHSESGVASGKPRVWRVDFAPSNINPLLRGIKPHGEQLNEAHQSATLKLQEWITLIAKRHAAEAKQALLPPVEFPMASPIALLAVAPAFASPVPVGPLVSGVCAGTPVLYDIGPPSEAREKMQARLAAFAKFFTALRGKNETYDIQMQPPMIWKEQQRGDEWEFLLEGSLLNGPLMVDYEIAMVGVPNKWWRINDCKVLREAAAKPQTPGRPTMPALPTLPGQ